MKDPHADALHSILRTRIRAGDYPPGSALPSWRQLAMEVGVGLSTVRQAFARLSDEGLIEWSGTQAIAHPDGQAAADERPHSPEHPRSRVHRKPVEVPSTRSPGGAKGLAADVLRLLVESLSVGLAFLSRVDGDTLVIEAVDDRAGMGMSAGDVVPLCDSYCTTMLETASPSLVVEDAQRDPEYAPRITTRTLGIGAYSGVPLYHADGRLFGTLCTLHPSARAVEESELTLLTLAGRIIMQAVDAEDSATSGSGFGAEEGGEAMIVVDGQRNILAWNDLAQARYALEKRGRTAGSVLDLLDSLDRGRATSEVHRALQDGGDVQTRWKFLAADGESRPAAVTLSSLRSVRGGPSELVIRVRLVPLKQPA